MIFMGTSLILTCRESEIFFVSVPCRGTLPVVRSDLHPRVTYVSFVPWSAIVAAGSFLSIVTVFSLHTLWKDGHHETSLLVAPLQTHCHHAGHPRDDLLALSPIDTAPSRGRYPHDQSALCSHQLHLDECHPSRHLSAAATNLLPFWLAQHQRELVYRRSFFHRHVCMRLQKFVLWHFWFSGGKCGER
jgi:hypothetical protein